MPQPSTVSEVRSFSGLVNYYARFVPGLAGIMSPIYRLLTKDETNFQWNKECEIAFKEIKGQIANDLVLAHSSKGISSVLFHRDEDVKERSIACVSRTFTPAEKNYAVICQEALALVFGLKKFEQYIRGRRITIRTNHKPLVGLFGKNKGISERSKDRLQGWAIYVASFDYKIEHIKGKENVIPDYLSRMPIKTEVRTEEDKYSGYLNFAATVEEWPIDKNEVKEATSNELKPYWRRREELTKENGCILWGHTMVIPRRIRSRMLGELHVTHLGIVKTKSVARSYLWWPRLD